MTFVEVSGYFDDITIDHLSSVLDQAEASADIRGVVLNIDSPGLIADDDDFIELANRYAGTDEDVGVWVGPTGAEAVGPVAELVASLPAAAMAPGATLVFDGQSTLEGSFPTGRTLNASEALKVGVVEAVANSAVDYLGPLPWFDTQLSRTDEGAPVQTPVTKVRFSKLPLGARWMHSAASPPIAYVCFVAGLGLLLFEFFTAGIGVAGLVGALGLLLGGYGLGAVPHRLWAVAALVLAFVLMAFDVQPGLPRFWTVASTGVFTVGSLWLFDGVRQPWTALLIGIGGFAVFAFSGMPSMVRARFGTPTVGRDHLVGELAEVVETVDPMGEVLVGRARWRARTHRLTPVPAGERARVVGIDGLVLEVEPEAGGAVDYREMRSRSKGTSAQEGVNPDGSAPAHGD